MTTFFCSLLLLFHIVLDRMCCQTDYKSFQPYVSLKTKYIHLGICFVILIVSWVFFLFDIRTTMVKFLTNIITLPWWFYIFKYEICKIIYVDDQGIELLTNESVISQKVDKFSIDDDFEIEKNKETEFENGEEEEENVITYGD